MYEGYNWLLRIQCHEHLEKMAMFENIIFVSAFNWDKSSNIIIDGFNNKYFW